MPKVIPEYKDEARKKIIKSALDTFFEKGYNETKMTDIAEALGVSKGALYQYFDSKDKLFLEAFNLYLNEKRIALTEFLRRKGVEGLATETFFELSIPGLQDSGYTVDLISQLPNDGRLKKRFLNTTKKKSTI